ncbi:MAG: hypothetical protein IEMM0008_0890 [bacterium]|nr:MAG: hypothetical protein IEMM0008_0890 [bacterium]
MKSRFPKLFVSILAFCWVFSYLNIPGLFLLLDHGIVCQRCHDTSFIYKKGRLQLVLTHKMYRHKHKSHGNTHKPTTPFMIAGDSNSHVFPFFLTNHYKPKDNNEKLLYQIGLFQPVKWDKPKEFVNPVCLPYRSPSGLPDPDLSNTTILLI